MQRASAGIKSQGPTRLHKNCILVSPDEQEKMKASLEGPSSIPSSIPPSPNQLFLLHLWEGEDGGWRRLAGWELFQQQGALIWQHADSLELEDCPPGTPARWLGLEYPSGGFSPCWSGGGSWDWS